MIVSGPLTMAGLEIVATLPVTNLFEGRIVKVTGSFFYYFSSGVWEALSPASAGVLPPQNFPADANKLLMTDGNDTFWVADPLGQTGKFLQWDGLQHVWGNPLPTPQLLNGILSSDGTDAFWTANPLGQTGKFLQWNGTAHVWAPSITEPQLLNGLLTSDGTNEFWTANPISAIPGQFLQWDGVAHVWGNGPTGVPDMNLMENWLLSNDGAQPIWVADPTSALVGQFLQWTGTGHTWATPTGSVPDPSGHTDKFLQSDGTTALWDTVKRGDLNAGLVNAVLINDGTGMMSAEAQLAQVRGGFGENVSTFTGYVQALAGDFFAGPIAAGDIPTGIPADNIGLGTVDNVMFDRVSGLGRYESTSNITGGVLSVNADPTKFDLSAGAGVIMDYVTDPNKPIFLPRSFAGGTALTVTNLVTADQTYIMIDSAGSIIQQTTFPTPTQIRDNIYVGVLAHANRTSVSAARSIGNHTESVGSHMFDFWNAVGPFNIIGNTIAPNGSNLTFQKSAGFMFSAFYNQTVTPKDPHRISMSSAAPVSFGYRTKDSALGGTPADQTLIDPTFYDLGGVKTAIGATASNATVQRVYLLPTGQIRVQYGQQIYTNLATALANMGQELFVTNPALVGYAILIGYIVAQQNAATLNSTLFARVFSAARFEVGPAAGALPSTTQQQAYNNSAVPILVLSADVGAFNIRDASSPLGIDLFSVTDFAGTAKYIQVDIQGIKSNKISPSLALVSDSNGAIVSLAGLTSTEMGYLTDVTSPIQAQLNTKASISGTLAQFAPTTSLQFIGAISDETGTGLLVFNNSPALISPVITSGAVLRGDLVLQNITGAQPTLQLSEDPDNGTNKITIQAPAALGADYTLTLPIDDGTPSQFLQTNGSGVLTWASALANPMTTLGDMIYGAASGVATRFAGNITAVRQVLTQTGTGSVSAAPVWSDDLATSSSNGRVTPRRAQQGLTVTCPQGGWNAGVVRAVGIYYQDQSGAHRLKFNITGLIDSATITGITITIAGVTFKNVANFYQAVSTTILGGNVSNARTNPGTGDIQSFNVSQNGIVGMGYSGDVELESKPSWA